MAGARAHGGEGAEVHRFVLDEVGVEELAGVQSTTRAWACLRWYGVNGKGKREHSRDKERVCVHCGMDGMGCQSTAQANKLKDVSTHAW